MSINIFIKMSYFFPTREDKVKAFLFSQINLHFFLKSNFCSVREASVNFTVWFPLFSLALFILFSCLDFHQHRNYEPWPSFGRWLTEVVGGSWAYFFLEILPFSNLFGRCFKTVLELFSNLKSSYFHEIPVQ